MCNNDYPLVPSVVRNFDFAQANSLSLALVPPVGFTLTLEMTEHGFVCLIFTRSDYTVELHNWANTLDAMLGPDHNRNAYPYALNLQVNWKVFLPLFEKQDPNQNAILKLTGTFEKPIHTLVIPLSPNL